MSVAHLHCVKVFLFPSSKFYQSNQNNSQKFCPIEGNRVAYIETPKYPGCYPRLGEIVIRRLQNINSKSKSKASMSEAHLHAVKGSCEIA